MRIDLCGESVELLPDNALHWPAQRLLVIADAHFGKDDIFRRAGIGLPRGPVIGDLQKLTRLLAGTGATRLLVVGDFVHGPRRPGDDFLRLFRLWRLQHPGLVLQVVAGNHDRLENAARWSELLEWHTSPVVQGPFVFAHEPRADPAGYVIAGHLHPVFRARDIVGPRGVRVFWQRADYLVLPSFGEFTGGATVHPSPGDRIYAATPDGVHPLFGVAQTGRPT